MKNILIIAGPSAVGKTTVAHRMLDLEPRFEFVRSAKWVREFAPAAVHPTQLYEALCYLLTFAILWWMYHRTDAPRRRGLLFGVAMIGIFLTRFFIEFIKVDQVAFEQGMTFNMGQWLSVPFVVLGIVSIWYSYHKGIVAEKAAKSPAKSHEVKTAKRKR